MKHIFLKVCFLFVLIIFSANCIANEAENKLSQLENSVFSKSYDGEDYETRLSRLEKEMFGASQRGSLEQRLEKLWLSNSYTCNEQSGEYSAIVNSNKGVKGFWNKLKTEYLNGAVTGYTPSVYDSYGFNTNFGGMNNFNNYPFNRYNQSFPDYNPFKNDYQNFYNPTENAFAQRRFMPISYPLRPQYMTLRQPQLLNSSSYGTTKVTLIND